MFKIILLVSVLITLGLVNAQDWSADDIKIAKIVFCGNCGDDKVKQDLRNFGDCARKDYSAETDKIIAIKKGETDPEKCMTKVKDEFAAFKKANPDGMAKIMKCFHDNVKKEDLTKC